MSSMLSQPAQSGCNHRMKFRLLVCIGYVVLVYLAIADYISVQLMGAGFFIGAIVQTIIDHR